MEEKGICNECIYNENCKYNRQYPVKNCDEHTTFKNKTTG